LTETHQAVLCREIVELVMNPALRDFSTARASNEQVVFVDATFGRGGHSRALLGELAPDARLIAIDRDMEAVAVAQELASVDSRVTACHGRFSDISSILADLGLVSVQGVILDLGVSSPQLNEARRGFSFLSDGPLDMRMDQSAELTAAKWLNEAEESEISTVLKRLGEERYARRIAKAIVAARPLNTTSELAEVVSRAQPRGTPGKHDATRTFQAVRMRVNDELEELEQGLLASFSCLAMNGRLAVISFHSLEDRLVKRFIRKLSQAPSLPRRLPVRNSEIVVPGRKVAGPLRATSSETRDNPRARSALLRVVERAA